MFQGEVCKARIPGWAETGNMRRRVRNKLTQMVVAALKRMLIIIIIIAVYLCSECLLYASMC